MEQLPETTAELLQSTTGILKGRKDTVDRKLFAATEFNPYSANLSRIKTLSVI